MKTLVLGTVSEDVGARCDNIRTLWNPHQRARRAQRAIRRQATLLRLIAIAGRARELIRVPSDDDPIQSP